MCDAFTRMDLERALSDLAPRKEDTDHTALDKSITGLEDASPSGFDAVIDTLKDARDSLDEDAPDGKTVLAAMDRVIFALGQLEEFRDTFNDKVSETVRKYDDFMGSNEDRGKIDVDDLIAELEYRGYQIIKVPRTIARTVPAVRARRTRMRKAA